MSEAIATKLEELGNLYCDTGDTEVGLLLKELARSPDRARSLRSALLENTSLYTTNKHLENSVESSSHNPSQQLLESIISTDNKQLSKHQIDRILDITRLWDRDPQDISYLKVMISKWSTEPSSFYGQLIYEHKPDQISLLKLCIEQYKQIEDEAKVNSIRRRVILVIIFEAVKKEKQELLRKSKMKKRIPSTANYAQPLRSQAIDALAHRLWDSQKVSPEDFSQKKTRLLRMARCGEKWSVIKPAGLILGLEGNSQSFEQKKWSMLEIQAINELLCTFKIYSLLPTLEAAFQTIKAQCSPTITATEHETVRYQSPGNFPEQSVQQNDHYPRWDAIPPLPNPHPSTTGREPAINTNPANFNSNPISIDALLNPVDYIAGSTQSRQLAIARNLPIQITNGAVLSGYGQDSTAGEHAEFGSSRGKKRGLESQTEARDSPSKQRRIHSFSGLDSSLSQSSNTRSAYQTEVIGTNIAIMAEVCKLESPLGVQLFKGMDATYIRDLEKQTRCWKFTDAVRLYLPSPEVKDYKLEVWICPSIGKVISQAKESAKDLRDVLDEYLFDAVNTSDWKKEQERNGLQGFANVVTVSFPKGDGSDCKVEIILSAEKGSEFYENVFPIFD
ncbi:hypothetical protein SBOR_8806 [Sclerotinia borealis F-4128]|uniref:Uncharacterized protein n=1 Tax=Sclerotinia borealis (strain F-4128) TaxID=1432307 RepID=W9C4M2_SCLBF|nr:hypothetical protein SBOR_8806 [Sclerotinia borealis F-4128]